MTDEERGATAPTGGPDHSSAGRPPGPEVPAPRRRGKGAGLRLLKINREFRCYWASQAVTNIGNEFYRMTMLLTMSRLSGSSLRVMAGATVALALPHMAAAVFGGPVIDRANPRRLMIFLDLLAAAVTAGGVFFVRHGILAGIAAMMVFNSIIGGLYNSTKSPMVRRIVAPEDLFSSNALIGLTGVLAVAVGPTLAGITVQRWGPEVAIVADAVTFLASALLLIMVRPLARVAGTAGRYLAQLQAGMSFLLRGSKELRRLLLLLGLPVHLLTGCSLVLWIPFIETVLRASASETGVSASAYGIGFALGGFLASQRLIRDRRKQNIIIGATLLWSIAQVAKGLAPNTFFFTLMNLLHGAIGVPFFAALSTIIQLRTPLELQGRISGTWGAAGQAAGMAGMGLGPVIGLALGMRGTYLGLGVAGVVLAVTQMLFPAVPDDAPLPDSTKLEGSAPDKRE